MGNMGEICNTKPMNSSLIKIKAIMDGCASILSEEIFDL
jgi:hypothetical protein